MGAFFGWTPSVPTPFSQRIAMSDSERELNSSADEETEASEDERLLYEQGNNVDERDISTSTMAEFIQAVKEVSVEELQLDANLRHGQIRAVDPNQVMALQQSFTRDRPTEKFRVVAWRSKCALHFEIHLDNRSYIVLSGQHTVATLKKLISEYNSRAIPVPEV